MEVTVTNCDRDRSDGLTQSKTVVFRCKWQWLADIARLMRKPGLDFIKKNLENVYPWRKTVKTRKIYGENQKFFVKPGNLWENLGKTWGKPGNLGGGKRWENRHHFVNTRRTLGKLVENQENLGKTLQKEFFFGLAPWVEVYKMIVTEVSCDIIIIIKHEIEMSTVHQIHKFKKKKITFNPCVTDWFNWVQLKYFSFKLKNFFTNLVKQSIYFNLTWKKVKKKKKNVSDLHPILELLFPNIDKI